MMKYQKLNNLYLPGKIAIHIKIVLVSFLLVVLFALSRGSSMNFTEQLFLFVLLISELENDSTKIELDSILSFTTTGTIFSGVSKKNIDYLKNLRVEDYEKEFIEQKIKRNKIK